MSARPGAGRLGLHQRRLLPSAWRVYSSLLLMERLPYLARISDISLESRRRLPRLSAGAQYHIAFLAANLQPASFS